MEINSSVVIKLNDNIIVEYNNMIIHTFTDISAMPSIYLGKAGNYCVYYNYINDFDYITSDYIEFEVNDEKILLISNLKDTWYYQNTLKFDYYGFYLNNIYNVSLSVKAPSGKVYNITDKKFTPEETGIYEFTFSSDIEGDIIEKKVDINVIFAPSSLFTTGNYITSINNAAQLPSYA